MAHQIADRLDRDIFSRYMDLAAGGSIVQVQTLDRVVGVSREWLDTLQSVWPYYAWIGYLDGAGEVVSATGGVLEGVSLSHRPVFIDGRKGVFFGDVHAAVVLEKLLPRQQEPHRFVDVALPVRDQHGQIAGVLAAHISWEWAREVRQSVLPQDAVERGLDALVLDRAGEVVLGPPELQGQQLSPALLSAVSTQGYAVTAWPDGERYLTGVATSAGYREFAGLGWQILVRQEAGVAFAPVRRLQLQMLLLGAALALLFFLTGLWNARRIAAPLVAITAEAERLRAGASDVRLPQTAPYREAAILGQSLQGLLADLAQRDQALQQLNYTLNEESQRKDQFIAMLSHELRNPLAAIRNTLRVLQRRPVADKADGRRLEVIARQTGHLCRLVDDLLDATRIRRDTVELRPERVDLAVLVAQAAEALQPLVEEHQHRLELALPANVAPVLGDSDRLEQVIVNLLLNAIKYTPAGGRIAVRVQAEEGRALLRVVDSGAGIDPEFLEQVFELFERGGRELDHTQGGLGLGLAVSRQLVELHGGSITARSAGAQQGSEFVVTLPLASADGLARLCESDCGT